MDPYQVFPSLKSPLNALIVEIQKSACLFLDKIYLNYNLSYDLEQDARYTIAILSSPSRKENQEALKLFLVCLVNTHFSLAKLNFLQWKIFHLNRFWYHISRFLHRNASTPPKVSRAQHIPRISREVNARKAIQK